MNRDHALFAKSLAGGLPLLSDTLEHLVALGIIPVVFHRPLATEKTLAGVSHVETGLEEIEPSVIFHLPN